MKNLLNKIGKISKLALIPALAFTLNSEKADAQKENSSKVHFSSDFLGSFAATNYPSLNLYNNWQSHFMGLDGDEELKYNKYWLNVNFILNADLGITAGKYSFGLNSKIELVDLFGSQDLASIELHNWNFDYAKIVQIRESEKLPSIGPFLKISLGDGKELIFRDYIGRAKIIEEKREDINLPSKLKCTPTPIDNTSDLTRIFEKKVINHLTNTFSLGYSTEDYYDSKHGWGLYYKSDFNKFHELGLNFSWFFW